eukprot:8709189-Alexandrium_andersonii.AAC.1
MHTHSGPRLRARGRHAPTASGRVGRLVVQCDPSCFAAVWALLVACLARVGMRHGGPTGQVQGPGPERARQGPQRGSSSSAPRQRA